jgi:hypothetical protein
MGDRVERQAPEQLGGAVTEPECRKCVAELVDSLTSSMIATTSPPG